ncbi:MAG: hypothetical protein NWR72_21465 [Bacteroidia bacterium]|nr:hypothetical protein [Bacteroidia bacterium]
MKTFLSFFLLVFALNTFAQQAVKEISLEKRYIDYDFSHTIAGIIDARRESGGIGYAYTGLGNKVTRAVLEGGFEQALGQLFFSIPTPETDQAPVWIKIQHLQIGEMRSPNTEYSVGFLHADFLIREGDQYYLQFRATAAEMNFGLDATSHHDLNIERMLTRVLMDYDDAEARRQLSRIPIAENQLSAYDLDTLSNALATLSDCKPGIYQTYYDFRDQQPQPFGELVFTLYKEGVEGKENAAFDNWPTDTQQPFAFTKGRDTYLRVEDDYYLPIRRKYDHWTLTMKEEASGAGAAIGGAAFGLVGALAGHLIESASTDNYDLKLNYNSPLMLYPIGNSDPDVQQPAYVFASEFMPVDETIEVVMDGATVCELGPGQAFEVPLRSGEFEKNLCIRYQDQETCTVVFTRLDMPTLFLAKPTRKELSLTFHPDNLATRYQDKIQEEESTTPCGQ